MSGKVGKVEKGVKLSSSLAVCLLQFLPCHRPTGYAHLTRMFRDDVAQRGAEFQQTQCVHCALFCSEKSSVLFRNMKNIQNINNDDMYREYEEHAKCSELLQIIYIYIYRHI